MWILRQVNGSAWLIDSIQWGRFIGTSGAIIVIASSRLLVQSGTNFDGRKVCDAAQSNAHKQHSANSADSALLLFMKDENAPQIAQEYDDTRPQACADCQPRSPHREHTRRPARNPENGRHEGPVCKVCKAPVVERVWACSVHQVAECDEKERCDEYRDGLVGLKDKRVDIDASRDLTYNRKSGPSFERRPIQTERTFHGNSVATKSQSSESG